MGGNRVKWGKMGKPNQSTSAPQFLSFAPTSPHFPPLSPIPPPFFLVPGTLWVRCWVYYDPPRPGISEACHIGGYHRLVIVNDVLATSSLPLFTPLLLLLLKLLPLLLLCADVTMESKMV